MDFLNPADLTTEIDLERFQRITSPYNEETYAPAVKVMVHWIDETISTVDKNGSMISYEAMILALEPIKARDVLIIKQQRYNVLKSHERSFFDEGTKFYEVYINK